MARSAKNKGFIYEFGEFVLDPRERTLLAHGETVHLTGKVFETLLMLVEHNGQLLTKDRMMTSIWPNSFVEEGNLAKNVSRLRKILNSDDATLIETLPKHGYRFRAHIREIDDSPDLLIHRSTRVRITETSCNDEARRDAPPKAFRDIRSLAILPFQPLSARSDDDFFGLALTDALITRLNGIGHILIRPTSSILKFAERGQDGLVAGRELQVEAVLEGRFQRSGCRLRLTVQMLLTMTGELLWAETFDLEAAEIFDVQDEVATHALRSLGKELGEISRQPDTSRRDTENPAAYQEYLRGRLFWSRRSTTDHQRAIERFTRAIELDPLYGRAYAGLADVYNSLPVYDGFAPHAYFPQAKAAALKALAIDKDLAEAHAALGQSLLQYEWNWSGAELSFRRAIKLDPKYAAAYQLLGVYLYRVERVGEAIVALKKAQELDPDSPVNSTWLAEMFRYAGEIDASIRLHQETLEAFPEFSLAHYHLATAYIQAGRLDEADLHSRQAVKLSGGNSLTVSLRGILHWMRGDRPAYDRTITKLLRMRSEKYISAVNIASVYAAAGDRDKAIGWLETALSERDPNMTWINFDQEFHFLRQDARFRRLVEETGLAKRTLSKERSVP